MEWTIKGEPGAGLDATERPLSDLKCADARLILSSLESDSLAWTARTDNATGAGTIVPSAGQQVELFHNGIRRFRGNVTIPRAQLTQVVFTAEGPWWWMSRIQLTQEQVDPSGNTDTRPSFVFPTQDLKTSMTSLLERAIDDGVPIEIGQIDEMFTFPRITLAQMSYAQALAELMRIVPDAVAWFDYTGTGLPKLNITRRGAMPTVTVTLGSDAVEDLDVWPRLDLEVREVQVASVARDGTTGVASWESQTAGTPEVGKRQIVVVSGPEVTDFLPEEKDGTASIQSLAIPGGGIGRETLGAGSPHTETIITGAFKDFVLAADPLIATMIREYGSSFSDGLYLSNGGRFYVSAFASGSLASGAIYHDLDKLRVVAADDPTGFFPVISPDAIPSWLADENGVQVRTGAQLTGYVRYLGYPEPDAPSWWSDAVSKAEESLIGYPANDGGVQWERNLFFPFSIPIGLVDVEYSTLTSVIRQWSFDYIQPPADLAANLQATQDWIPYQGRIRSIADQVNGASQLGAVFNVVNSLPELATMKALPRRVSYEISRGRKTIELGAPSRVDFGTLANRFKRHPKDNFVYV